MLVREPWRFNQRCNTSSAKALSPATSQAPDQKSRPQWADHFQELHKSMLPKKPTAI
jgi:hypothetical protein